MAENCCWYIATQVPSGCTAFSEDDVITLPCESPCADRYVEDSGPCQGAYLIALDEACLPCDGFASASGESLDTAKARARQTKPDRSKAKPISAAALRGLRKVAP